MALLEAHGLCKRYNEKEVLRNVSIAAEPGELVALLGVSGVGKTTLFNLLSGLDQPDSGSVLLRGENITGQPGKLGYMQQKDLLLPFAKAIDNAAAPLTLRKVPKQEARETVKPYFAKFGLGGCEDLYPNQLSGGMRQRVALIRALLFSADMLLLDEPLSALDTLTRADMQEFLRTALREAGCTAVLVTHDPEEALFLADRIYILSGKPGHISAEYRVPVPQNAAMQPTRGLLLSPEYIDLKRRILATL